MIESSSRNPCRILVVDDDVDIRTAVQDLLTAEGYDAVGAGDGREALDKLAVLPPPNLILLDIMMPGMDGLEFLAERARDVRLSKIPVVVVSAFTRQTHYAGATALIQKPFKLERLLSVVAAHCEDGQ